MICQVRREVRGAGAGATDRKRPYPHLMFIALSILTGGWFLPFYIGHWLLRRKRFR